MNPLHESNLKCKIRLIPINCEKLQLVFFLQWPHTLTQILPIHLLDTHFVQTIAETMNYVSFLGSHGGEYEDGYLLNCKNV
jgi:hypothetical protein